jgi:hypothetical protein
MRRPHGQSPHGLAVWVIDHFRQAGHYPCRRYVQLLTEKGSR